MYEYFLCTLAYPICLFSLLPCVVFSSFVMIIYFCGGKWSCRCRDTFGGWGAIS